MKIIFCSIIFILLINVLHCKKFLVEVEKEAKSVRSRNSLEVYDEESLSLEVSDEETDGISF